MMGTDITFDLVSKVLDVNFNDELVSPGIPEGQASLRLCFEDSNLATAASRQTPYHFKMNSELKSLPAVYLRTHERLSRLQRIEHEHNVRFHCLFLGEGAPSISDGCWDQIDEEWREESDEERRGGRTEGGGGTFNSSDLETGLISMHKTPPASTPLLHGIEVHRLRPTASTWAISSAYSHKSEFRSFSAKQAVTIILSALNSSKLGLVDRDAAEMLK